MLLAAGTTLAFPWALRTLIDRGLAEQAAPEVLATQFVELFMVAAALAVFLSAAQCCGSIAACTVAGILASEPVRL